MLYIKTFIFNRYRLNIYKNYITHGYIYREKIHSKPFEANRHLQLTISDPTVNVFGSHTSPSPARIAAAKAVVQCLALFEWLHGACRLGFNVCIETEGRVNHWCNRLVGGAQNKIWLDWGGAACDAKTSFENTVILNLVQGGIDHVPFQWELLDLTQPCTSAHETISQKEGYEQKKQKHVGTKTTGYS